MSQMFPFVPSATTQFQFSPVLDGDVYNCLVPWILFGSRYYLSLLAIDGTQVWYGGIVGSPQAQNIASLSWANGYAYATTFTPHGFRVASVVTGTIAGCSPDAYNGLFELFATGPSSLRYALSVNPGTATVLGAVDQRINLIGGVQKPDGTFFSSSLVFWETLQSFEASP